MNKTKTIQVNPKSKLAKTLVKIANEKKELRDALEAGKSLTEFKKEKGYKFARPV